MPPRKKGVKPTKEAVIRAKVTLALKQRVLDYLAALDEEDEMDESKLLRKAVIEFLDAKEDPKTPLPKPTVVQLKPGEIKGKPVRDVTKDSGQQKNPSQK